MAADRIRARKTPATLKLCCRRGNGYHLRECKHRGIIAACGGGSLFSRLFFP